MLAASGPEFCAEPRSRIVKRWHGDPNQADCGVFGVPRRSGPPVLTFPAGGGPAWGLSRPDVASITSKSSGFGAWQEGCGKYYE